MLTFLISIPGLYCSAQQADTTEYKLQVYENDPMQARNLSFIFVPIYVQGYGQNFNSGFAFGAAYRHEDKYLLTADFMQAWGKRYGDRKQEDYDPFRNGTYVPGGGGPGGWPVNGSRPYRDISVGGTYFFGKQVKMKQIKVNEEISDTFTFTSSISQPRLHWYGLRAGVSYLRTWIGDFEKYTFYDTTSNEVRSSQYLYGSMMNAPMLWFGISQGNLFHSAYEVNDFGRHHWSGSFNIYGDVYFAPYMWLSDMNLVDEHQDYQVVNFTEQSGNYPFGFRIGASRSDLSAYGFNIGLEFGLKPGKGYWDDNFFALLKAWFNVSTYLPKKPVIEG